MIKKIYKTMMLLLSRKEMQKRNLSKEVIDGWTIEKICDIYHLDNPRKNIEEEINKNINIIKKRVNDIIEYSMIEDKVDRIISEDYDWLLSKVDKKPEDLI